jgi:hypothetical protein
MEISAGEKNKPEIVLFNTFMVYVTIMEIFLALNLRRPFCVYAVNNLISYFTINL